MKTTVTIEQSGKKILLAGNFFPGLYQRTPFVENDCLKRTIFFPCTAVRAVRVYSLVGELN